MTLKEYEWLALKTLGLTKLKCEICKKSNYVLENTIFKVHMENVQESNYDKEFNKAQLSNWSG